VIAIGEDDEEVSLCGAPHYAESDDAEPVFSVVNASPAHRIISGA
jgi:hypothetical protein